MSEAARPACPSDAMSYEEHAVRAADAHARYAAAYTAAHGVDAGSVQLIGWLQTAAGRTALDVAYRAAGLIA